MNYVIAVWLGAFVAFVGFMLLNDNIQYGPKWLQTWWKRHICDTEENLWPNG